MRISDWISDVCSSDLGCLSFDYHPAEGSLWGQKIRYKISETAKTFSFPHAAGKPPLWLMHNWGTGCDTRSLVIFEGEGDAASYYQLTGGKYPVVPVPIGARSEVHTAELQSLMRISYVFFLFTNKQVKHIT